MPKIKELKTERIKYYDFEINKWREERVTPSHKNKDNEKAKQLGMELGEFHYKHHVKRVKPILPPIKEHTEKPIEEGKKPLEYQITSITESKPSEESEINPKDFNYEEWKKIRDEVCPNCDSCPYLKDNVLFIYCPRPKFIDRKMKGEKGNVNIESCRSTQKYFLRSIQGKKTEINSLRTEHSKLTSEIERLKEELKKYHSIESEKSANKIGSIIEGKHIFCKRVNRIISICDCFDEQDKLEKEPEHFKPPSLRCPCDKFRYLEVKEIAKYNSIETIPWMNPKVKNMFLREIEELYGIN